MAKDTKPIRFSAWEGGLVHDALTDFVKDHSAKARESRGDQAEAHQSWAKMVQKIADEMEQSNQPGDYGHWELKWCEE